uniref:RCR-type E3 ubiquitin transferase n=1 Tax=Branchiostoma floridae TaxID=7739 RepID=C3ZT19_BRAFL|eukprot:XP_002588353.1 hypothetical protein BRAFLDRAFT_81492 [Branchiostoma floridae]
MSERCWGIIFDIENAVRSVQPTFQPSVQPTSQPSVQPTSQPSVQPTSQPSVQPRKRGNGPKCKWLKPGEQRAELSGNTITHLLSNSNNPGHFAVNCAKLLFSGPELRAGHYALIEVPGVNPYIVPLNQVVGWKTVELLQAVEFTYSNSKKHGKLIMTAPGENGRVLFYMRDKMKEGKENTQPTEKERTPKKSGHKQLLIDLVNNSGPETSPTTDCTSLAALACSCLLSLVVARGDTGKLLNAVAALLISPGSQSAQAVKVPSILSSLQRSVVAVLLGKPQQPSWLSCGITKESLVDTWKLESLEKVAREFDESRSSYSAIQSDGHYLYIHCLSGLYKIGSGYSGTIKGHVYAANPAFHTKEKGWLGYAKGQLFFRSRCHAANSLVLVNTETLEEQQVFELEDTRRGCKVFFTDGENIGQIVADREDSFLVRFYNPLVSPMPVTQELPLRLARKCLDLCGWANFDQNQELHTTSLGVDEEVVSVTSGKDIAIIRTTSGKLLYTGKSQQLGIKQGGPPLGKWAELPITKSPRVVQCSMGHEGVHGLLVSEDGSVFFCGTARRGEDGDQVKRARQPKPSKPKKMIKLEGRHVVWSACNVGSSAVVTKEGELYMFGKDTAYADTTTGLISDLKEEAVTQISLGKAHACVLTAKGEVFTFGVNNKGQCGRDFTPQQKEGASAGAMAVGAEDDHDEDVTEEASDPSLCPPGTHVWKMERCMVCTVCGECTGYGASCVSSGMPGRNPGTACGCGSGDSGCSECGICKSCAGEDDPNRQSKMKELAQLKKLLPGCVDVMIAADGYASDDRDQERDPVVLLQNGEVYTFGNNQMGQLGCKDSHNRGLPVRVELPERAVQVAAGSNHTVILTSQGNVYTFGAFAKGQLGREHGSWHPGNTEPGMVTGVGPKFGRRATWVGASGDQTFIKIDESLINARTLADATLFADQKCIGVVVDLEDDGPPVPGRSLFISMTDGTAKVIYQPNTYAVSCYNATAGEVRDFPPQESDRTGTCNLLSPELVLPTVPVAMTTRSHSALHLLGCLDTLTVCQDFGFAVTEQAQDVHSVARIFSKEDYNAVNRFDSHGGGWGYSVHSVEAIRFTADADIILGGFGLFGGRGEYTAKIKLFDLGTEGGEHEGDGDLLCETDDMTYECGSREKYAILFEEPILLTANNWYVGWARVSGPSSDCGASGQTMVTTDDQLPTLDSNCSNGVKCQMEPVHILSRDFSRSVSPSCFESLLDLLRWSWATFKLGVEELQGLKGVHFTAALLDLDRLVFVSTACMRLLRRYISEVYPNGTLSKKTPAESARLSECVGETRAVLRKILCEENMFHLPQPSPSHTPSRRESSHDSCKRLVNRVLEECHHTFTCCFHAFYPTSSLKWVCLCDLLGLLESGSEQNEGIGRLLSAVMAALCHPTVKLTSLLPILKESESDPQLPSTANSPDENNSNSSPTTPVTRDNVRFPILVQHMEHRSQVSPILVQHMEHRSQVSPILVQHMEHRSQVSPILVQHMEHRSQVSPIVVQHMEHRSQVSPILVQHMEHRSQVSPILVQHMQVSLILVQHMEHTSQVSLNLVQHMEHRSQVSLNLVQHMEHRSQLEGAGTGHCTFKEVLDKLLAIVVVPVRIQLSGEEVIYSDALVCNTCALLAAIVGELATAATGSENEIQRSTMPVSCTPSRFARVSQGKSWNTGNGSPDAVCFSVDKPGVVVNEIQRSTMPVSCTPSRFARVSQGKSWNTGNGSPDAVCFSVDKPGVVVVGAMLYGGGGQHDYELELLDSSESDIGDGSHTQRWTTLELVKGTYYPEDCVNDAAEVKFERPVPIKEGVKYAVRVRNHGGRTANGDGGLPTVKSADGVTFTFSSCSLSSNGTNQTRGQIPNILYYRTPQEGEAHAAQSSRLMAESHSRRTVLSVATAVLKSATDILRRALVTPEMEVMEILGSAHILSSLLPLLLANLGPVASSDPRTSVQVLSLVQDVLPAVASLNQRYAPPPPILNQSAQSIEATLLEGNTNTTSAHYAMVESEHPYKPATVAHYKISFPNSVKWMAVEFDPQCGTAQPEDSLQLYIPGRHFRKGAVWEDSPQASGWWSVLKKFHGIDAWPNGAVVLPGNEIAFSLETASDYMKDEKLCFYGFKCSVVGYEWCSTTEEVLVQLEKELSYLGAMCATMLMRKDLQLPAVSSTEAEEDMDSLEEGAQLEPKSIIDEIIKERIARKLPELMEKVRGRKGGPGMYQVVKCGASGHNVRCRPSLRATPVGMLVLGNQLTATEETSNSDGTWVRLSKHSTQQYCESDEGEAWSLAHGKNDITYLKHESELSSEREDSLALFSPSPFSSPFGSGPTTPSAKGFDFRGAEVTPPNFWFSQPTDNAAAAASSPSVFGPDPKLEVLDMYGNTAGAGIPLAQADNLPAFPPDPFVFGAAVDLTGTPNFYFSSVPPTKERKPTPSPTRDGLPLKNKQGDNVEERRPNQGMKREGGSSDSEKENTVPSCSKEKGDVIVELKETAPEVIKAEPEKKPSRTRNSGIPIPRKGASPPRSKSGSPSESPKSRPSSPLVKSESSSPRLQRKDRHRADSDSSKSHGDSEKHGTRADSPKSRPELPPKPDLRKTRAEGPKHGIISSLKSDATARSRSESPVGKIHREVTVDLRSRSKSPRGRAGSDHQKSHTDCSSPGRTGSIKGKTDVPRSRIEAVKAKAEAPIISTGPLRKTEGSSAVIDGRHDEVHAVKQETKLSRRAHCTVHEVGKGTECTVHVSRIPSPRSSLIIPNKERVLSLEDSTRQSNGESLTTTTVNTCTPDTHATKTVETAEHNAKPANDVIVLTKESNAVVENGHPPSGADGTDEAVRPSSVTPPPPVSSSPPTTRKATPPPNDSVKEHVKGQFTIGLGGPREEAERVSPKLGRKERTVRHLRNKRDRAMSPVPKEKPSVEIPSAKPKLSLSRKPVKDAISPSVAECMRAVFAAFLWHEGIVHDAMACASFLKFHPNLTKEASSGQTKEQVSSEMEDFRDPRLKNRHSMELTSALKKLAEREAPSNINALVNPEPSPKRVAGKVNDSRGVSPSKVAKSSETKKEPQLPLTLQHLVSFWEEVSAFVLNMATQQVILPSPAELVKNKKERKEREKKKKKEKWPQQQGKQQQQQQQQQQQGRGNLFGEAAGAPFVAGGEKDAACELCGGTFPHPVTYHMKQAHPGCGKHAAGMGYNSGGNYCGGWAGNCGDGGVGGSSWYLMCEKCRDKYLKEKKAAQKEKVKKAKKRVIPLKPPRTMTPMEAHNIMKNNALFLLNFGSAMGPHIPAQSPVSRRQLLRHELPVVSEGDLDHAHFPSVPFLYLQQIAAQQGHNLCPMSFNDNLFREENRFRSDSFGTPQRTISITPDTSPHKEEDLVFAGPMSVDSSPVGEGLSPRVPFQRSISMQGTIPSSEVEILDNSGMGSLKLRSSRRRTVSGNSESGSSLLRHPSSQLARLVESRAKQRDLRDKARQWPVIAFIIQRHDLEGLEVAMRQSLRKAACRVHAMEALNWLLRSVTQPTCLHDLLWFFVASLTPPVIELEMEEEPEEKKRKKEADVPADQKPIPEDVVPRRALENRRLLKIEDRETTVSDHPLSDITVAGEAVYPLPQAFHHLLQTISDIMMVLPNGSALQQIAMRCYCLRFRPADHMFLHRSHVFNNISQILSKSDEGDGDETISTSSASMGDGSSTAVTQVNYTVECLRDITAQIELKASSRTAMIASLTDGSTETFWESGDEDRNKTKSLTLTCCRGSVPRMVYIHIDNTRDLANKVTSVIFSAGAATEDLSKIRVVELEPRHVGWVHCHLPGPYCRVIKVELKGPDNSLRVRQIKVLGEDVGKAIVEANQLAPVVIQQKNCEAETLRVFRLLTKQVFGKLISSEDRLVEPDSKEASEAEEKGESDLREHMVGILFSRSKLTNLQKQVCAHIVQAISMETARVRDEWEANLSSQTEAGTPTQEPKPAEPLILADTYCFELLSMVLALSGSTVGRAYLAQQLGLMKDLLSLLHTGTPRVQRQVASLLRRVLPEAPPQQLANILGITSLPPTDISILTQASYKPENVQKDTQGILDVFLGCITKALSVQVKVKGGGGLVEKAASKGVNSISLATALNSRVKNSSSRWWLRGSVPSDIAQLIIRLVKDMSMGKLSEEWARVTKSAVAESIMTLTKMEEEQRQPQECLYTATLWLALASLCVLDQDHVERLSSGQWVGKDGQPKQKPTCDNHDDGETLAIILCSDCGNLCAECDRYLHLHRKTRQHQRQVFKEEEESIKVDLHEGCGRTKLFWVMALADSKTLKAMVEFRERNGGKMTSSASAGTCRFCGASSNTGLLAIGNVCADPECQEHARNACTRTLPCGHPCGGVKDEDTCLPCLHGCKGADGMTLKQDADDMCMVCFTEALSAAPAIQLICGHVFHQHCCRNVLERKWVGPRISFGFSLCPICKCEIDHPTLKDLLAPIRALYDDVKRKALMRLEYEGLSQCEAITTPGARFYNDTAGYAMNRYAYYVCYKCNKAYYGGEARCDQEAGVGEDYDPAELVCGACSDVSRAQMCPKHGTDFLEYKCRYCCSVAVFFCFGTTHFCNPCHDDFQRVTNIPKQELPHCPAGKDGSNLYFHFCNPCHDDFQRVTNIPKQELPHCPAGPRGKQLEGDECPLHVTHPPTGEEFALGCGVCRNAHTF